MTPVRTAPGPDADYAFRLGVIAGAILGFAVLGLSFWGGVVGPIGLGYLLLAVFPVYMVFVTVLLSVWLGYDKDETALRPVYREKESDPE